MKRRHIVIGITGSIAAYKACEVITKLKRAGFDISCVMTEDAKNFITPLTLQTLSSNKVMTDMFELPDIWNPLHISLAKRADLILIAPASADIIGKLANGICDELLTCVVLATRAKVLIAPAMNENMYEHKIVQENIERLKKIGYRFIGPVKGRLADGAIGIGHLADVGKIVGEVTKALK